MKETILVVDDTPTNLQVLVRFLAAQGYRILVAEDGASALDQAVREKPDVIILDIMMPGLDGYETCRHLKESRETRDIPVLFMSARTGTEDKVRGFEAGGVDYITKPYQKEEVVARVNAHLTIVRQKRQLQRMLEQRNRFMRIAAHDLRNPVVAMAGWIFLGTSATDLEGARKVFRRFEKAIVQMRAIIDDFLAFNLLQAGHPGEMGPFDLAPVIQQVMEQQGTIAQAKGIRLCKDCPEQVLCATGSAAHTHQILTNYVSNALKYSLANTTVELSIEPRADHWRLAVRDQGPGIAKDERDMLFVEFAKISNKPTAGEPSTGLGLSIVKALAEAQGGRVGADFPDGGGSVFWCEIPMVMPKTAAMNLH